MTVVAAARRAFEKMERERKKAENGEACTAPIAPLK
jgi:hypothetical protein